MLIWYAYNDAYGTLGLIMFVDGVFLSQVELEKLIADGSEPFVCSVEPSSKVWLYDQLARTSTLVEVLSSRQERLLLLKNLVLVLLGERSDALESPEREVVRADAFDAGVFLGTYATERAFDLVPAFDAGIEGVKEFSSRLLGSFRERAAQSFEGFSFEDLRVCERRISELLVFTRDELLLALHERTVFLGWFSLVS